MAAGRVRLDDHPGRRSGDRHAQAPAGPAIALRMAQGSFTDDAAGLCRWSKRPTFGQATRRRAHHSGRWGHVPGPPRSSSTMIRFPLGVTGERKDRAQQGPPPRRGFQCGDSRRNGGPTPRDRARGFYVRRSSRPRGTPGQGPPATTPATASSSPAMTPASDPAGPRGAERVGHVEHPGQARPLRPPRPRPGGRSPGKKWTFPSATRLKSGPRSGQSAVARDLGHSRQGGRGHTVPARILDWRAGGPVLCRQTFTTKPRGGPPPRDPPPDHKKV